MNPAIVTKNLVKIYDTTKALDGLNLVVERGDVYGFLGPNGAGKTTTLRILATLLRADGGRASVMGYDVYRESRKARCIVGFMPDETGMYRDLLVGEYLEIFAAAYHVPDSDVDKTVNGCLDMTGLIDKKHELIEALSRGMRQRLGLARCLINDPAVLLLDEPASGLDPRARIEIQEVLRTLGRMGKTVVVSSHILAELHHMCNKIGIIENGKLIYSGPIDDALASTCTSRKIEIRLVDGTDRACDLIAKRSEVANAYIEDDRILIDLHEGIDDYGFVADVLVRAGYRVLTIKEKEVLLQDAFLKMTGGQDQESEE